jgi:hypothetical protein
MIDVNELRCGNILHYTTAEGDILNTIIDWQDIKWISEDQKGFNLVHSRIRLDDDNVIKLGFDYFHKHNLGYKGESESFYLSDWYGDISVFYGNEQIEVYFVNELQNLYFAITGIELTFSEPLNHQTIIK